MSETTSVCPICKGAGYVRANVPYGHPQFGKPIACACKEAEWAQRRRRQLVAMSNLAALGDKSFATFNKRIPGVVEAFRAAWAFAQQPTDWLLLVGPHGCGKTHLAAAIANTCLLQERSVLFVTAPDLLDHLRATFAPTATVAYDELFGRVREAEVLVIDDLGAQQPSPWAAEKLFQLLNHRYTRSLPTVITANEAGLQVMDARIRSRCQIQAWCGRSVSMKRLTTGPTVLLRSVSTQSRPCNSFTKPEVVTSRRRGRYDTPTGCATR